MSANLVVSKASWTDTKVVAFFAAALLSFLAAEFKLLDVNSVLLENVTHVLIAVVPQRKSFNIGVFCVEAKARLFKSKRIYTQSNSILYQVFYIKYAIQVFYAQSNSILSILPHPKSNAVRAAIPNQIRQLRQCHRLAK